jgi:hypothetical protein
MYLSCSVIQENVIFDHGEDQFSLEVLTPDGWCHPRHWNLRKVNYVLPPYLFDHMSCPTAVKYIYWTRCFKFTMFPCIPTREYVWRHRRVVINRVVPREADRPIHNNQPSGRPLRSHDGSWDEQTVQATSETGRVPIQSSWLSILPVKDSVISVPCFLAAPLLSNLGRRFSLRGGGL